QTVNLLCELRRFESCSPHGKAEKPENLKFSIFLKSRKKCLKTCKFNDLRVFFVLGLFSIFIKAHKISVAKSWHFLPIIFWTQLFSATVQGTELVLKQIIF
ncbi:MAG: hypothetical protein RSH24_19405, partial [Flavobacterium sp.]